MLTCQKHKIHKGWVADIYNLSVNVLQESPKPITFIFSLLLEIKLIDVCIKEKSSP